jgi:hypothetical protein
MSDPDAPHWRPSYTGVDPAVGDVGSGRGFGADTYQLYKAGRLHLPTIAQQYHDLTQLVHRTQGPSYRTFEVDGSVERAHRLWMELRDELQEILRESCVNFEAAGAALVRIADRYVRTDEEAQRQMSKLMDKESHLYKAGRSSVRTPPAPADYAAPTPQPADGHSPAEPV